VFVTGHTGFKGAWLTIWLEQMGAIVKGYSVDVPTNPSLFEIVHQKLDVQHCIGDIIDLTHLQAEVELFQPEIIFHLAAQPLVSESYKDPVKTFNTNVMGTVNILEVIRMTDSIKAGVIITTDKCYHNQEWLWGYRESDRLGGYDPYSNSKACAELVVDSYNNSFFKTNNSKYVATARAGNVIGGGDWALNRLVPDCLNAIENGDPIVLRSPKSVRPWQHVLEPLAGYLELGYELLNESEIHASAWNFGPKNDGVVNVENIVKKLYKFYEKESLLEVSDEKHFHETNLLLLDTNKAEKLMNWKPRWSIDTTLMKIVQWHMAYLNNENILDLCQQQIIEFIGED